MVLVLLHERVVELLEARHDGRHVLLRGQDRRPQMEHPANCSHVTDCNIITDQGQTVIGFCNNRYDDDDDDQEDWFPTMVQSRWE